MDGPIDLDAGCALFTAEAHAAFVTLAPRIEHQLRTAGRGLTVKDAMSLVGRAVSGELAEERAPAPAAAGRYARAAVEAAGGHALLSTDGSYSERPAAAPGWASLRDQ